jgi:hypothetical protein
VQDFMIKMTTMRLLPAKRLVFLILSMMYAQVVAANPATLNLIKTVSITTDAEYGSARPEIVRTADRVFVLYLGHIEGGSTGRTFDVKIYDADLVTQTAHQVIVQHDSNYGRAVDQRENIPGVIIPS